MPLTKYCKSSVYAASIPKKAYPMNEVPLLNISRNSIDLASEPMGVISWTIAFGQLYIGPVNIVPIRLDVYRVVLGKELRNIGTTE